MLSVENVKKAYREPDGSLLPILEESAQVTELAMSIQKPDQLPDVLQRKVSLILSMCVCVLS